MLKPTCGYLCSYMQNNVCYKIGIEQITANWMSCMLRLGHTSYFNYSGNFLFQYSNYYKLSNTYQIILQFVTGAIFLRKRHQSCFKLKKTQRHYFLELLSYETMKLAIAKRDNVIRKMRYPQAILSGAFASGWCLCNKVAACDRTFKMHRGFSTV